MSDDDSEPQEESTKQVDREMLNKALNDSVDSHEVMKRVNAQLADDLHDGGTARVDRDAVAQYLEAARSGEFPTVDPTSRSMTEGPQAGKAPPPGPPPTPSRPGPKAGPAQEESLPDIASAMVEPVEDAPAVRQRGDSAQHRSWASGTAEVEPEPVRLSEPRMLTWILVLAAAGILLGLAMAVAWMALAQ